MQQLIERALERLVRLAREEPGRESVREGGTGGALVESGRVVDDLRDEAVGRPCGCVGAAAERVDDVDNSH